MSTMFAEGEGNLEVAVGDTFAELLWSRRTDHAIGVRFDDQEWTWAEVVREASSRACLLEEWRTGGGQIHIGVFLENIPDYVFWLGAAALTGDVIVGVNPTRRGRDLAQDIRHTDCSALILEDKTAELLTGVNHGIKPERVVNVDSYEYKSTLARASGPFQPQLPDPDATLLLLFSSGSTGAPKAVICSQGRLGGLAHALAERMRIRRDSVTYLCMPLFHGNALMTNLSPAIRSGATVVLARRFSASGLIKDIRRYGVTYWNYVGRALAYVLATPEMPDDADNTLQLAYGTEASPNDVTSFSQRFGCEVMEGYGASEGGLRINRTPDTPEGAMGLPVGEKQVEVVDAESFESCPTAEFDSNGRITNADVAIGQMVVRGGASSFEGYYKNPEAMAERIHGDDFWTGDLAYRDQDGFLYFAGRTADWIRVDGENFAAAPIERVLQRHPAISQAIVYGVPDSQTGDQVMVTLVLAPGQILDPTEFLQFMDGQSDMGTKWRPQYVRICSELPITGNGKVARAELRREAWQTSDDVWRWDVKQGYVLLDKRERARLVEDFAKHGRDHLLPTSGV